MVDLPSWSPDGAPINPKWQENVDLFQKGFIEAFAARKGMSTEEVREITSHHIAIAMGRAVLQQRLTPEDLELVLVSGR